MHLTAYMALSIHAHTLFERNSPDTTEASLDRGGGTTAPSVLALSSATISLTSAT